MVGSDRPRPRPLRLVLSTARAPPTKQWGQEPGTQSSSAGRKTGLGVKPRCGRAPPARTRQLTWQAAGGACMFACARRASVILFTFVTAFALLAPAIDAEPRSDNTGPLPISYV